VSGLFKLIFASVSLTNLLKLDKSNSFQGSSFAELSVPSLPAIGLDFN
jgi:hypothetical protein